LATASFTAPASVSIAASASDADGTISKVEFFSGTTLLGTVTTAPYIFTWNNVAAGSYSLTAKATDNSGLTTTSTAVSITVKAPLTATSVSIHDSSAHYLQGSVVLAVRLSKASNADVYVNYKTEDGTARASSHYVAAQGVLTIPAGSVSATIRINLLYSSTFKNLSSKNFQVKLSNCINGALSDSVARAVISYKKQGTTTTTQSTSAIAQSTSSIRQTNLMEPTLSQELTLKVYPNPTTSYFTVAMQSNSQEPLMLNVYDVSGRMVEARKGLTPGSSIQFGNHLSRGVYHVEVIQGNSKTQLKISKL
jgi:hypothetical protein